MDSTLAFTPLLYSLNRSAVIVPASRRNISADMTGGLLCGQRFNEADNRIKATSRPAQAVYVMPLNASLSGDNSFPFLVSIIMLPACPNLLLSATVSL